MTSTKPSSLSSTPSTPDFPAANTYFIPHDVCPFNYHGYCKKTRCPLQHLVDTCQMGPACSNHNCRETKRHPKLCKWYQLSGYCNLGLNCNYSHLNVFERINNLNETNSDLKNQIMKQNEILAELMNTISKLAPMLSTPVNAVSEEKNENIMIKAKQSSVTKDEQFCDECGKFYSSKSGLTRHKKSKHADPDTIPPALAPTPASPASTSTLPSCQSSSTSSFTPTEDETKKDKANPEDIIDPKFEETCIDQPFKGRILRGKKKKEFAILVQERLASYYSKYDINSIHPTKYIWDKANGARYKYNNRKEAKMRFSQGGLSVILFYSQVPDKDVFPDPRIECIGEDTIKYISSDVDIENKNKECVEVQEKLTNFDSKYDVNKIHPAKFIWDKANGARYKYNNTKEAEIRFSQGGLSVILFYSQVPDKDVFPDPRLECIGENTIKYINSDIDVEDENIKEDIDVHQAEKLINKENLNEENDQLLNEIESEIFKH